MQVFLSGVEEGISSSEKVPFRREFPFFSVPLSEISVYNDIWNCCLVWCRESLNLVKQYNLKQVAFPAVSCGIYGFPLDEAAETIISAFKEYGRGLEEIAVILSSHRSFREFEKAASRTLERAAPPGSSQPQEHWVSWVCGRSSCSVRCLWAILNAMAPSDFGASVLWETLSEAERLATGHFTKCAYWTPCLCCGPPDSAGRCPWETVFNVLG